MPETTRLMPRCLVLLICAAWLTPNVLVADPNSTQPNNPNFPDWYQSLLCPWNVDTCGHERLGQHGPEWRGVPVGNAPNQNAQYLTTPPDKYVQDEPDRRTMSCGLCGHLKRRLGTPPMMEEPPPLTHEVPQRQRQLFTANWDFHPFGAWLANDAVANGRRVADVVRDINVFKASNGEEIHGYLWQSLRLLAYDTGSLDGRRKEGAQLLDGVAVEHMLSVCEPMWWLAPQTRDDCAHAAGHGAHSADTARARSPPLIGDRSQAYLTRPCRALAEFRRCHTHARTLHALCSHIHTHLHDRCLTRTHTHSLHDRCLTRTHTHSVVSRAWQGSSTTTST